MTQETDATIIMLMLRNDEFVITEVADESIDAWNFMTPAIVSTQRSPQGSLGFMLTAWMPYELMQDTHVLFSKKDALGMLEPHPKLILYYKAWAETERDKIDTFGKEFADQIDHIKNYHVKKYERTKEFYQGEASANNGKISGSLAEYFDTETDWGNSSTFH